MKKGVFILSVFLLFYGEISSQIFTINKTNLDSFPKVEIDVNVHDLKSYSYSDFKIQENGVDLDFDLSKIESKEITNYSKNILILVERFKTKRIKYFKKVLADAIPRFIENGDSINIAVFDVVRNSGNKTVYPLLSNYTDNIDSLLFAVENIKKKPDKYLKNTYGKMPSDIRLDLYQGIFEGLQHLNSHYKNNKFLVVFSAGRNNDAGTIDANTIKKYARNHNIPIYNMQYFIEGYGNTNLKDVAEETSAKHYSSSIKWQRTSDKLVEFMNGAVVNNTGHTYRLTYNSSFPLDGNLKNINVSLKDKKIIVPINTPKVNIFASIWRKYKLLIIVLLSLAFLGLLFLVLSLTTKSNAKVKFENPDYNNLDYNYDYDIPDYSDSYTSSYQNDNISEDIISKMKEFGAFPKLFYKKNDAIISFIIDRPTISIGKASSNDFVIDEKSIDKIHAQVYFANECYKIKNINNSHITIRGNKIHEDVKLTNGLRISLNNVELIFTI